MYGAQAVAKLDVLKDVFENDVEMYGAQALMEDSAVIFAFENDVEMYGAQADTKLSSEAG